MSRAAPVIHHVFRITRAEARSAEQISPRPRARHLAATSSVPRDIGDAHAEIGERLRVAGVLPAWQGSNDSILMSSNGHMYSSSEWCQIRVPTNTHAAIPAMPLLAMHTSQGYVPVGAYGSLRVDAERPPLRRYQRARLIFAAVAGIALLGVAGGDLFIRSAPPRADRRPSRRRARHPRQRQAAPPPLRAAPRGPWQSRAARRASLGHR